MRLLAFSLLSILPFAALAEPHSGPAVHRHRDVARRIPGEVELHKRFSGARFTYYAVGLGACGKYNVPSDFIVALNSAQYGGGYPGPNCFKSITISYGGKSAQATIMDECPGCPYGGLDFSEGLFQHFAPLSVGVLYGTWNFNGGGGSPPHAPPPPPPPPPKKTTTHQNPVSTHDPPPSTTTTKTSTSTTTHKTSTHKSASTPSVNTASILAEGIAIPTGVVPVSSPSDPENVEGINQAIINMAGMIKAGAGLS